MSMRARSGEPLLKVAGLHVAYGKAEVVHGVDFEVRSGEFVLMLGRNGAGKSTIMFWSTNPNHAWCHNLTVENCTINNTQTSLSMGEGVTFFGCKDVSFHHNTLTNCPKVMLDLANNTKNCDIHHNTFITTKGSGIKLDASQSTKVSAWDENIRIYNNLFFGTYTAIKIGVEKKWMQKHLLLQQHHQHQKLVPWGETRRSQRLLLTTLRKPPHHP